MAQKLIAAATCFALAMGAPANSADSDDVLKALLGIAAIGLIVKSADDKKSKSSETQNTRTEHIHSSRKNRPVIRHRHSHYHKDGTTRSHEHAHEMADSVLRGGVTFSKWHETAHIKPKKKPKPQPKVIEHSHRHIHQHKGHTHAQRHKHTHRHELPGWLRFGTETFKKWHRDQHQRGASASWQQNNHIQGWAKHNH